VTTAIAERQETAVLGQDAARIAGVRVELGDPASARELARLLDDNVWRAVIMAHAGDVQEAVDLAGTSIRDASLARFALKTIAEVVADSGAAELAIEIVGLVDLPVEQLWAITEVAVRIGRRGDMGCARELAHRAEHIASELEGVGALWWAVAELFAFVGEADRVEELAHRTLTMDEPGGTLVTSIAYLAAAGNLEAAARVSACAWLREPWTDPVETLTAVDPAAARALADALCAGPAKV
jgi:hypothetical protein